jgi:hypothetical protein
MAIKRSQHNNVPLSKNALDIIEGELLGDGFIGMTPCQSYFKLRTADPEYANWLLKCLLAEEVPIVPCGMAKQEIWTDKKGKEHISFVVRTQATVQFGDLRHKWYDGRRKRIPHDLELNPVRILHWWVGDGSVRKGCSAVFCTDCFNLEEHRLLIDKMNIFGLHAVIEKGVGKKKNHLRLYLPSQACELIEQIGTCPFESMSHKWNVRPHGRIMAPILISPLELKNLYIEQNLSAKKIAEMFGCSRHIIYEKARSMGLRKDPKKRSISTMWSKDLIDEILALSKTHLVSEIVVKTGIGRKKIRHILEDAGLRKMRSNFWANQGVNNEN